MSPSRNSEPSLRIWLGKRRLVRSVTCSKGKPFYRIVFEDDDRPNTGGGTPPTPPEARYVRPSWMIEASYIHGQQSEAKKRTVYGSPTAGFAQLSQAFHGFDQTAVTNLALNLIQIVEEKGLLRGYSCICVAGGCVLAAERALDKTIIYQGTPEAIGVETKAMWSAYLKLRTEMHKSGRAKKAVVDAGGDPKRFPGKPLITSKSKVNIQGSVRSMMLDQMVARGSSRLSDVVCTDELPELKEEFGFPLQRTDSHNADAQDDDLIFEFEDCSREDETEELAEFGRAFGGGMVPGAKRQYGRPRSNAIVNMGIALGNLVV